ncbi:antibiotic biosynthesis monooxygenase [uncultured Maribacter sp.]|uniref:antibiotic biosynthesis monooxygenase family protein n=1 Tax=uncultured Maribacter sp. TaxID=431308 RepID=UPI00261C70EC|nr:antibiotic biosynthesis monooxygenase [uncultured Maribacter sp.]
MILEVAVLNIKQGLESKFEKDFTLASEYIQSVKGYRSHTLRRCLEDNSQYILLVDWVDVESHEVGFRKSKGYLKWKELLHDYYDPFPKVNHYETVFENKKQ